jgi:hypothetical protein
MRNSTDTVIDALEAAANVLPEAFSDAADALGNAIEDGVNGLGRQWGRSFIIARFSGETVKWLGRITAGAVEIIGACVKGGFGISGGLLAGTLRIIAGITLLNAGQIIRGLKDTGAGISGGVVVAGGKSIAAFHYLFFLQAAKRRLTDQEIVNLKRIFKDSLAYYNIRLVEGRAGIYDVSTRPFAMGNTIYLKKRDIAENPGLLVHECVHVWQYQHLGARYAGDAIGAQWFLDDAYNWRKEFDKGKSWMQFNKEAQAKFVETVYNNGKSIQDATAGITGTKGAFFDTDEKQPANQFTDGDDDLTAFANDSVKVLRTKFKRSFSRLFA